MGVGFLLSVVGEVSPGRLAAWAQTGPVLFLASVNDVSSHRQHLLAVAAIQSADGCRAFPMPLRVPLVVAACVAASQAALCLWSRSQHCCRDYCARQLSIRFPSTEMAWK